MNVGPPAGGDTRGIVPVLAVLGMARVSFDTLHRVVLREGAARIAGATVKSARMQEASIIKRM